MDKARLLAVLIAVAVLGAFGGLLEAYNRLEAEHSALERRFLALNEAYAGLNTSYWALSASYSDLNASFQELSREHSSLKLSHQRLSTDYADLCERHDALNLSYQVLLLNYDQLNQTHQLLISEYNELSESYQTLAHNYTELKREYGGLFSDYTSLLQNHDALLEAFYKPLSHKEVPSVEELKEWLDADETDKVQYIMPDFMCGDFAVMLSLHAKLKHWDMGVVVVIGRDRSGKPFIHAFNAIVCKEGLVYVEPQTDSVWWYDEHEEITEGCWAELPDFGCVYVEGYIVVVLY